MKEKTVDPDRRSARSELRSSLLTLSPRGPWFYVLLLLAQTAAVVLVTSSLGLPFRLTLATLFATEGIASMVVAWLLSGREGDIGAAAMAQVRRAQIAGAPGLLTSIPEHQADIDSAARNTPYILILVMYGVTLMAIAFVAAV